MYDVIVIGAGPAGISAAIYAVSRGCRTLVLERGEVGGVIGKVSTVTHYAGIVAQETGVSFAARLKAQALAAGVEIVFGEATAVSLRGKMKTVTVREKQFAAPKLILANGCTARRLGIPGEETLRGRGVEDNAALAGPRYQGKNIYVVGGADGAVKEALFLARYAARLTIVHFEPRLGCIAEFLQKVEATPNISVCTGYRLAAIHGDEQIEALELVSEQDGRVRRVEDAGCGVFVYAGSTPNTALYPELSLGNGFIPVEENMQTQIPGVYAVGDIRVKQVRQVATAVADGAIAGIHAATH